jgi:hypothetical protein
MGRGNSGAPVGWGDVINGGRTRLRGVPEKITVYGRIRRLVGQQHFVRVGVAV